MIKKFMKKCRSWLLDGYFQEVHQHLEGLNAEIKYIRSLTEGLDRDGKQWQQEQRQELASIQQRLVVIEEVARNAWLAAARSEDTLQSFQSNWQVETMMKYEDVSGYKTLRHIEKMHKLLNIKNVVAGEGKLYRTGHENDGGYIMLDKLLENKVAYSFGISDDVSWDKFMTEQGFDVYMYDHTIEKLPEENEKFHWKKIGLTGIYDENHSELRTLPMLLEDNGHLDKKHIILKMDIEGAEWEALCTLPDKFMEQFDQIMLEFHNMNREDNYPKMEMALEKLNKTHQLVHLHGNNWENYTMMAGRVMPNVIECTYIKKDVCGFEERKGGSPDELDHANNEKWPDIFLGKWN